MIVLYPLLAKITFLKAIINFMSKTRAGLRFSLWCIPADADHFSRGDPLRNGVVSCWWFTHLCCFVQQSQVIFYLKMRAKQLTIFVFLGLIVHVCCVFNIANTGKNGVQMNQADCNVHTLLNFNFSSNTQAANCATGTKCALVNANQSYFGFQNSSGNQVTLPLVDYTWSSGDSMASFATGYGTVGGAITIDGAAIFEFQQLTPTTTTVDVYIPFTTAGPTTNPNVVDLTSSKIPNSLSGFNGNSILSAFNFFDQSNYNQWYVQNINTRYVLVSKFVYKINSVNNMVTSTQTPASTINGMALSATTAAATGQKLCYASTITGNFQNIFQYVVAVWFIWFVIFFYWLLYLFSESITKSCVDREHFSDNVWTCWSLYSIIKVAHEEYFTKLSRMTVELIQLTIQGVIIAAILSQQYVTGPAAFVWAAFIAWASTIIFPFMWGQIFHKRIYQKYRHKYNHMKKILEGREKNKSKEELQVQEEHIYVCQQKIYGYFHWFYCVAFFLFCVCWPVTVHLMEIIPNYAYSSNWYWLAGMGVCFFFEHFVYEPILIYFFSSRAVIKNRGGYFYDFRLGEMHSDVSED